PGKTERDQKAHITDEVILKWSKMTPDERAKDSVIYSLRSLPSCQSDLLLPIDFSNTVLAQREMSIYR
ncbi:TPA: hypothetical protein ACNBPA_001255, partial [Escherichia coli]